MILTLGSCQVFTPPCELFAPSQKDTPPSLKTTALHKGKKLMMERKKN